MKYACYLVDERFGRLYEYAVLDRERRLKFALSFQVPPAVEKHAVIDVRARMAEFYERKLWAGIKIESPGTYLDAKARGWLPWADHSGSEDY